MPDTDRAVVRRVVDYAVALRPGGTLLPVARWAELLGAAGLDVPAIRGAASAVQAVAAAGELGYPVVVREPGEAGVRVESPDALLAVAGAWTELLVHADIGPTVPALHWSPAVAASVAWLRREAPEIDELELRVEADRRGRCWVVDAVVHVRAVSG